MKGPSLALLGVSLLWGTTFVAVKAGLEDASPLLFAGLRFLLATVGSLFLLGRAPDFRGAWKPSIPLGIAMALGYASQTIGLETTTPARSAFVTGLNVALVPLWGMALVGRPPGRLSLFGLALAIPGLWLLTDPGTGSWNVGDTWTVGCAVFFALHVVLLNRLAPGRPAGTLLTLQLLVTALLCLGASAVMEAPHVRFTPALILALLVTSLLATTGTTWLQIRFQPRVEPTRAALIYATEPVFAAFFSWLFFGELLPGLAWSGGALILLGMVLAELGSGRKRAGSSPPASGGAGPP